MLDLIALLVCAGIQMILAGVAIALLVTIGRALKINFRIWRKGRKP